MSSKNKRPSKKPTRKSSRKASQRYEAKSGNKKNVILTSGAPQPIGPYSQAVQVGSFLFCSGQVALDPVTGQMVGPDVASQARRVMENIRAVLEQASYKFDHVVKTTIFLRNLGDFSVVNDLYGSYFSGQPPARSTVEVSKLPKDALIEIEVVASK